MPINSSNHSLLFRGRLQKRKVRFNRRKREFENKKEEIKEEEIKHSVSPLIYDLTTKLGSEYETLKALSKMINNLSKIKKYSTDIVGKFYGEIGYDSNFAECNLNGEGLFSEEVKEHLLKKNGIYIKNNVMQIFSLIPYDTHMEYLKSDDIDEKVILPLLSPLNDRIIGALVLEGNEMYVKDTKKDDTLGLLTLLTTASRIVAISNEYEIDELVRGVKNKRSVNKRLNFTLNSKLDRNEELWFLMIDIDYFKKINDTYGHSVGDVILQNFGKTILDNVKNNSITGEKDEVFRFGGEEFCAIIKGDREAAIKAGERIKWCVAEKIMYTLEEKEVRVTCSIGIAEGTCLVKKYIQQGQNKEDALRNGINELIKKADDALYDAKRSGRNFLVEAKN